jgi:hypothetical protein
MKKGLSEINLDSREEEKKNEFGANLLEMTWMLHMKKRTEAIA